MTAHVPPTDEQLALWETMSCAVINLAEHRQRTLITEVRRLRSERDEVLRQLDVGDPTARGLVRAAVGIHRRIKAAEAERDEARAAFDEERREYKALANLLARALAERYRLSDALRHIANGAGYPLRIASNALAALDAKKKA